MSKNTPPSAEVGLPRKSRLKSFGKVAAVLGSFAYGMTGALPTIETRSVQSDSEAQAHIAAKVRSNQNEAVRRHCDQTRDDILCVIAGRDNAVRYNLGLHKNKTISSIKTKLPDRRIGNHMFEIRMTTKSHGPENRPQRIFVLKNKKTGEEFLVGPKLELIFKIAEARQRTKSNLNQKPSEIKKTSNREYFNKNIYLAHTGKQKGFTQHRQGNR